MIGPVRNSLTLAMHALCFECASHFSPLHRHHRSFTVECLIAFSVIISGVPPHGAEIKSMDNTLLPLKCTLLLAVSTAFLMLSGCGDSSATAAAPVVPPPVPPAPAQQAGYLVRTYGPNLMLVTSTSTAANTAGLFAWDFIGQALGGSLSPNSDSSISIVGGGTQGANSQLASAKSGSAAGSFEGIAFGGGGYFEAVLKFDGWQGQSANPKSQSGGWPAFWGMSVEHLAITGGDQVPGQAAGYENFIEMDFMEYNIENGQGNDEVYSGSLINWYGVFGQTCPGATPYCSIDNPYPSKIRQLADTVNFSDYHTYGALWVPATDTADGYIQWYFDGAQVGERVSWTQLTSLWATPPSPFSFGIGDLQHLVLILGTGTQYPMTVGSVSVWQQAGNNNLIH